MVRRRTGLSILAGLWPQRVVRFARMLGDPRSVSITRPGWRGATPGHFMVAGGSSSGEQQWGQGRCLGLFPEGNRESMTVLRLLPNGSP